MFAEAAYRPQVFKSHRQGLRLALDLGHGEALLMQGVAQRARADCEHAERWCTHGLVLPRLNGAGN